MCVQGTPMYIARSVCVGQVLYDRLAMLGSQMPILKGKALELYIKAHGRERYDLYSEKSDETCHGALPPKRDPDENTYPKFTHCPEHNAESVFWTSLSALLRVQPTASKREKYVNEAVTKVWGLLHGHSIPDHPTLDSDDRHMVLWRNRCSWKRLFADGMQDVAILMHDLVQQVACEYALYTGDLKIDHLHEAMQRLILQYLVDHQDQPIPLDPEALRPTTYKVNSELDEIPVLAGDTKGLPQEIAGVSPGHDSLRCVGKGSTRTAMCTREGSTQQTTLRPPAVSGSFTGSRDTQERRSANTTALIVDDIGRPKHKMKGQGGRGNKRLKGLSGSALSPPSDT